ncbi:hypothetical protein AAFF_G00014620 [Aldrovandia affinis]|uniref:Uncharacterized protein n=1 Tax=Aldrovandia affinis TaxID=143900 RepID=A0AAD7R2N2_9TELE|nr:hypothetical protein AAFF_G00014620 [Aldrovandia affinis]
MVFRGSSEFAEAISPERSAAEMGEKERSSPRHPSRNTADDAAVWALPKLDEKPPTIQTPFAAVSRTYAAGRNYAAASAPRRVPKV